MEPMRNRRLCRKSKLVGAIKSFVPSPVFGIISHVKRKGSVPPGWSWPCKISRRSSPLRERDCTPSFLKLPIMSASTRSKRGFAIARLSADTPKVNSLVLTMPLLLLAIWPSSISTYSLRISLYSSSFMGILILYLLSGRLLWLIKESWNGRELSKELRNAQ